jgi:hypothetical protein
MEQAKRSQTSVTHGTGIFGAGGALLIILFFTPWLRACGITFSGKDLALGIDTGFGVTTAPTYPWLILVLLAGVVAIGVVFFNLNRSQATIRRNALIPVVAGGVALALLLVLGLGFLGQVNDPASQLIDYGVEFGYIGSLCAAGAILGGGLMDLAGRSLGGGIRQSIPGLSPPRDAPIPYQPSPPSGALVGEKPAASLVVESGPLAGQTIAVSGEDFLIGRGSMCQLRIPDQAVSREHARLRQAQGSWFIQDQNSAAGTQVNGNRQMATRLNNGDRITIGSTTLIFRL